MILSRAGILLSILSFGVVFALEHGRSIDLAYLVVQVPGFSNGLRLGRVPLGNVSFRQSYKRITLDRYRLASARDTEGF